MAVNKNSEFTVLLGNLWHWARQPPGIYIVIIGFLVGALLYAYAPARQQVVYQAPVNNQYRAPVNNQYRAPTANRQETAADSCVRRGGVQINGNCEPAPGNAAYSRCPTGQSWVGRRIGCADLRPLDAADEAKLEE